jgi:hypothetical protein
MYTVYTDQAIKNVVPVHELLINLQNFQVYIFLLPARGKIRVIEKENQTEFRYLKKTFSVFMHAGRSGRLEPLTD